MPRVARRLACALAVAAAVGCETYVEGNGVFAEADRSGAVATFVGVHVEDAIQATVTVAEGSAPSVKVSGDANLLDYVRTEVLPESVLGESVEVLRVRVSVPGGSYSPKLPIRADVRVPGVRYLFASEGASTRASGAAATDLVLDVSGGASVVVEGAGGAELHATARDATVDAGAYPVDHAGVMLWGHAHGTVSAGQVSGEAHGTSTLANLFAESTCSGVVVFDSASVACPSVP